MKGKYGQHEIIGFVLIVVIVTIAGLVFFLFTFEKVGERESSIEVSNFLSASMYSTTDCAINFIPQYRDMQDLIKECYNDMSGSYVNCHDGREVCDALESSLGWLIKRSLIVGEDSVNKAYRLNIYYDSDPLNEFNDNDEVLFFEDGVFGNCSSVIGGSHPIMASSFSSGVIEVELEVCRG